MSLSPNLPPAPPILPRAERKPFKTTFKTHGNGAIGLQNIVMDGGEVSPESAVGRKTGDTLVNHASTSTEKTLPQLGTGKVVS